MPEIRPAHRTDYEAVAALWGQYHPEAAFTQDEFQVELPTYTVAVEDDVVVGFCVGHRSSAAWLECRVHPAPDAEWDCSYLESLVVDENARGRGLGTALLEDFASRVRRAGTSWVLLYPKRGDGRPVVSEELQRFYDRAGLRLLEPAEDHLRARPWMMGRPLVASPDHMFARSTAEVAAA